MIVPSDKDYKRTKAVKKSKRSLASPFKELADWISSRYDANVLNIEYSVITPGNRPRLYVILEKSSEESKFRDDSNMNFNCEIEKEILEEFISIIQKKGSSDFKKDGLFVVFSAFERVARIEANDSIPDSKIKKLKKQLNNKELWEISRCFDSVTFFFYTDQQLANSEKDGLRKVYARKYFDLISYYDEFGYISPDNISVCFDSKQNFDEKYDGSWFYYYR